MSNCSYGETIVNTESTFALVRLHVAVFGIDDVDVVLISSVLLY